MTSHTRVVQEATISSDGNDLDLSDAAVAAAVDGVRSGGHEWAVLGYQGNTGALKVVETGDGFEDLAEEMSAGKILYALWRAEENPKKLVYVVWVGEGVPVARKGLVNTHGHVVGSKVMQYFHVQVNARGEDDMDEAAIRKKIKSAGGADYDAGGGGKGVVLSSS